MRTLRFTLLPLLLVACTDREPVAPDIDASPMFGATHATSDLTIPMAQWYTSMDCLGYETGVWPDAVRWTASWLKMYQDYIYLPNGKDLQYRVKAEWSDDLRFETPAGDIWELVDNIYSAMWVSKLDRATGARATMHFHEHLVFENAATNARLKITNGNQLSINAHGDVMVADGRWGCKLTRPGK